MQKKAAVLLLLFLAFARPAFSFWMWTPETNRWVNPQYSVKDTPAKQLEYAMSFYRAKDYKKAMDEFQKLVRYYPRAKEAPEAEFYIGQCFEDQDRYFDAFKHYQKVIERYPFSDRSSDVVERQFHLGNKLMEGAGKRCGLGGILCGDGYDVVEIFRAVIKNAPYGPFAPQAQYKIGLYLQGKQLYQEARDEFEKVINDYPNSEWAKAAKYQIALADSKRSTEAPYDQKVTQAAVEGFKDFVKEYPDAELSDKAQEQIRRLREKEAQNNFLIGQFYEKHKNYDAARIYYDTIVKDFHDSTWAPKASEKLHRIGQESVQ